MNKLNIEWKISAIILIVLTLISILFIGYGSMFNKIPIKVEKVINTKLDKENVINSTFDKDVINSAQLAIYSSQTAIESIQSIITIVSLFVVLISSLGIIFISQAEKRIEKAQEAINKLYDDIKERTHIIDESMKNIHQQATTVTEELSKLTVQQNNLSTQYIETEKRAKALDAVFLIKSPDLATRTAYLRILAELIQPVGIESMGQILNDQREEEKLRSEAAYGLGRFADEELTSQYWDRIKEILSESLKIPDLPERLKKEVGGAFQKFNQG